MTRIRAFETYAAALDFALAETIRGMSALATGDLEGAQMLFETASEARTIADLMHEGASR